MPTMRLGDGRPRLRGRRRRCPSMHPGITYMLRPAVLRHAGAWKAATSTWATRSTAGQEAMILFDDVFVPWEHVFMDGETEFAAPAGRAVHRYHRRSYVCKTGLGDVLIGAAATIADYNGVEQASHVRDKLVEMAHLNETIYGAGMARSIESTPMPAGNYQRRPAGERLQAQRDALSVRDRAARAGPRRRADGDAAGASKTSTSRRSGRCSASTWQGARTSRPRTGCGCCG